MTSRKVYDDILCLEILYLQVFCKNTKRVKTSRTNPLWLRIIGFAEYLLHMMPLV